MSKNDDKLIENGLGHSLGFKNSPCKWEKNKTHT